MQKEIVLFRKKENCCGCGACYNICPTQAIAMTQDYNGFFYPTIMQNKCVGCEKCIQVCPIRIIKRGGR